MHLEDFFLSTYDFLATTNKNFGILRIYDYYYDFYYQYDDDDRRAGFFVTIRIHTFFFFSSLFRRLFQGSNVLALSVMSMCLYIFFPLFCAPCQRVGPGPWLPSLTLVITHTLTSREPSGGLHAPAGSLITAHPHHAPLTPARPPRPATQVFISKFLQGWLSCGVSVSPLPR